MNDKERNLQHAMMSFALWGGMLVNTKNTQRRRRPRGQPPVQLRAHQDSTASARQRRGI